MQKLFFKSTYLPMHNDTRFGTDLFSVGTHQRNRLSALGSQQGIIISASTVSHCGSPVWKNGSYSEHQCIGLLEEHCSNYIINLCQC